MFNSVALDVVIGLVFIYLLYSLLATVLSEIIATLLALRAKNLKEAIDRMLNDEQENSLIARLWDSFKLTKNPKNPVVNAFYENPEIKYLGSSGIFKTPSNFNSSSFSKTIMSLLFGKDKLTGDIIESKINNLIIDGIDEKGKVVKKKIDDATAGYIRGLWLEAQGDVDKFKLQLEGWFDRTMQQTTEWYKRKIQIVLLVLGFFMAWFFYADTFLIVKNLSTDKDAREQMVSMANAYVENNKSIVDGSAVKDSLEFTYSKQKLDSLLEIKKQLDADIAKANNIIGSGGWPPDTVYVASDRKTHERTYKPMIDGKSLSHEDKLVTNGKIGFSFWEKLGYFFRLFYHHFFGFLVTAIAISLGAPFWFDMLNKLVKLRTSKKDESGGNTTATETKAQPITIKIDTKTGEEAVG